MNKILVKCRNIHIGDILLASSVAKKIKQNKICEIHFDINYLQPLELLDCNPYIDKVFFMDSEKNYDIIYNLIPENFTLNPYESITSQFQKMCEIKNFDDTFEIFTNQVLDYSIEKSMSELKNIGDWKSDIIKVGYQMDWHKKSFLFTEDEYNNAIGGETGFGYGQKTRNTFDIINCMEHHPRVILFALGLEDTISKRYPTINSTSKFTFTASLIKNCDFVIGSEGCLTNMASALGIKTIITTDYIHQMFGPKGVVWQQNGGDLSNLESRIPFLGPNMYFPNQDHVHLSPFLSDADVGAEILKIVTNGR
tara:strand:- start:2628 stop:3554 length:927 start_codon:yes stop_codon:yes gene_type:complete